MTTSLSNNSLINIGNDDSGSSGVLPELSLSAAARFWVLLIFEILSLLCSLVLLFNLCFDRTLRQALHNHVIIIILIVGLFSQTIDVPNILTFFRLGYVWPQTPANCYIWWYVGTANFNTIGMLMAWGSIERHILVFHNQWHNTRKKRIYIHYIPLVTIVLYCFIFYAICVFFLPCENTFDYTEGWCLFPCFVTYSMLSLYDVLINGVLPIFVICASNIFLFVRVIRQKQRLRQEIQWHKYRRMIIQLVSCSTLYLLFDLPLKGLVTTQSFGVPYGATGQFELIVYYSSNFIVLGISFVCLGSSPEVWTKMKPKMKVQPVTIKTDLPAAQRNQQPQK